MIPIATIDLLLWAIIRSAELAITIIDEQPKELKELIGKEHLKHFKALLEWKDQFDKPAKESTRVRHLPSGVPAARLKRNATARRARGTARVRRVRARPAAAVK